MILESGPVTQSSVESPDIMGFITWRAIIRRQLPGYGTLPIPSDARPARELLKEHRWHLLRQPWPG